MYCPICGHLGLRLCFKSARCYQCGVTFQFTKFPPTGKMFELIRDAGRRVHESRQPGTPPTKP